MTYQFDRVRYNERMKWYLHDRFGLFLHFGLYSIPARGEWVRSDEEMPEEQMCIRDSAHDMLPVHTTRKLGQTKLHQDKRHSKNTNGLAQQHAKVRAKRHGIDKQSTHVHAHQAYLRVHKSKDGQDQEVQDVYKRQVYRFKEYLRRYPCS